jgi:hypothetical protein
MQAQEASPDTQMDSASKTPRPDLRQKILIAAIAVMVVLSLIRRPWSSRPTPKPGSRIRRKRPNSNAP